MGDTLSVLGGVIVAIAASFGIGNLLLAIYQRWIVRKDRSGAIHETNREAELDHDDKLQARLLNRVTALETEIKAMQQQQIEQARVQTKLEIENVDLKYVNERQEAEIVALQEQDAARVARIAHLEAQVAELSAAIDALNQRSLLNEKDLETLADCADTIQDSIKRLGFVPTGEMTEADNAAVQRLKEIRDASEKIAKVVGT